MRRRLSRTPAPAFRRYRAGRAAALGQADGDFPQSAEFREDWMNPFCPTDDLHRPWKSEWTATDRVGTEKARSPVMSARLHRWACPSRGHGVRISRPERALGELV
jgi:hypothetical protein